ncbi:MAG: hypothetical protein IKZ61_00075 [Prevotella sp.]|nr:hypothetical protein [Prevotella sp.]
MTKDKALEELFLSQKPHFSDKDDFMSALTKRLEAVEYIRQHQEATIRRYKMVMVAAFVIGVISGAVSIALVLSTPADIPLFNFRVQTGFLLWLTENSRIIVATALSMLMTMGIISIINNVQDILHMRKDLANSSLTI